MKNILLACLALLAYPSWSAAIDPDDDEALRDSITFNVKNGLVYYGRQPLPKLDAATFKVVEGLYISDKNGAYYCRVPTVLMDDSVMQDYRKEEKPGNYFPTQKIFWFMFECELHRLTAIREIKEIPGSGL